MKKLLYAHVLSRFLRDCGIVSPRTCCGLSAVAPQQVRGDSTGFTLIELSIVLVILGLIVGGIVGGKSLIHAANMQSLIRDYNGYLTAYNAFVSQYDAKPGDMADGWDYFGGGVNTICGGNTNTDLGCNGSGDGVLGYDSAGLGQSYSERARAWLHLQLAEIIVGKVRFENPTTIFQLSLPQYNAAGTTYFNNIPQAKGVEGDAGWGFFNPDWRRDGGGWWPSGTVFGRTGAWLVLGGAGWSDWWPFNGVLYPKDAAAIDKKLDDGIPTMGNVVSVLGATTGGSCESSGNGYYYSIDTLTPSPDHTYTLSNTSIPSCYMMFFIGD